MQAFDPATLDRWRTMAIVDRDGATVGTISELYLDRMTGQPTWALVSTGLFGSKHTFVPLLEAAELRDGLQVPYEKAHIKDAPRIDLDGQLTPEEEARLFAHYRIDYEPPSDVPPDAAPADRPGRAPQEAPAPSPPPGDVPPTEPAGTPDPVTLPTPLGVPVGLPPVLGGPIVDPGSVQYPAETDDRPRSDAPAAREEPGAPAPAEPGGGQAHGEGPGPSTARTVADQQSPLERVRLRLERWVRGDRPDPGSRG
jgi:hypothetical protein